MTHDKPKIALVCHRGDYPEKNRVLPDSLGTTYIQSIVKAGGLPFLIPLDFPLEELSVIRETCSGLLLTGGGDVETARYHGKEHPSVEGVWPVRDEIESRLYQLAIETDWPVFGICRGVQIMNVAAGGKLYSDIPDQVPGARFNHQQPAGTPRDAIVHNVEIKADSLLHKIIGKDSVPVNSFHHQAISVPGEGFITSAVSEDGIIEGIEKPDSPFVLGVQWHPECMQEYDDQMKLFRAFVEASRV
jgi:putative glutamine amidotransferase